ncbi:hypothetical protein ACM26_06180 [Helicobacter pylori]|nr:hypothetical protein ACM26_06180 [Helicobacter pylori]
MVNGAFYLMMCFIFLSYDALYLILFKAYFIQSLFYSKLILFKAYFIQSLFYSKLYSTPIPIVSNRFYLFISHSKNFKQTLSITCV